MVTLPTTRAPNLGDRVSARLAAFAVALAAVFAAAYGLGSAIEPVGEPTTPAPATNDADGHGADEEHRS